MASALPPPVTSPGPRRAWLGFVVFLVAAAYLFPFRDRVGLDSDEAKIILGTLRVLGGERLYVDVFEFVPPGLYALVGLALRLGGADPDILLLRGLMVLVGAGGVAATWAIAARALGRPILALAPAAAVLVFGLSHWFIASIHWLSTTFALLATWAMLDIGRERAPWRPWFLSGLATGAVLLVAQHKGVALVAAAAGLAVAYILHARRHLGRPRNRLMGPEDAFAVGFVLVLLPLCIGLAARGQFAPMVDAAFGWTREGYGVANRAPYGYGVGALFHPARWHAVGRIMGTPLSFLLRGVLLFALPASLVALLVRGGRRWVSAPDPRAWADVTVGLVGLAMWMTVWSRPDVLHHLTVAPWGVLAVLLLVIPPAPGPAPMSWRAIQRAVLGAAAVLVLAWGISDHLERSRWGTVRLGGLGFVHFPRTVAPNYTAADSDFAKTIAFLRNATAEGEPIFVYPYAPYFYYLADRPNPTPYNICIPGYQGRQAINTVIDRLESARVRYVVEDPSAVPENMAQILPGYDPALFTESPLTQYVHTRYTPVAQFGYVRILKRKGWR